MNVFFIFRCSRCKRRAKVAIEDVPRTDRIFASVVRRPCWRCFEKKNIANMKEWPEFIDTGIRVDGSGKRIDLLIPACLN